MVLLTSQSSGLGEKYYCLSATCALIKYLECEQNLVFKTSSILFKYQAIDGRVMVSRLFLFIQIDSTTARNLELVVSLSSGTGGGSGPTLLSVLNRTVTPMGSRLLRMNILSPLNGIFNIFIAF
jgi:DNA mismatch repair protein MSH4